MDLTWVYYYILAGGGICLFIIIFWGLTQSIFMPYKVLFCAYVHTAKQPRSRRKYELFNSQYCPCSQKVPNSNYPGVLELLNSKMCWRKEAHPPCNLSCACKQGVASAKSHKNGVSVNPSILSSWIYQHYGDVRVLV